MPLQSTTQTSNIIGSRSHVPADEDIVDGIWHALMTEADGAVKLTFADGSVDTLPLLASIWYPIQIKRVWATGTAAGVTLVHLGKIGA